MENEIVMVTEYLDKIALKLGIGAKAIWPYFVKQQYVWSFTSIIALLFCGIGVWINLKWLMLVTFDEDTYGTMKPTPAQGVRIGLLVAFSLGFIISIIAFFSVGINFFNPEYHALMEIFRTIKP